MYFRATLLFLLSIAISGLLPAQGAFDHWLQKKDDYHIEPFLALQLWSAYSFNQQEFDQEEKRYAPVDDRFSVLLRRARFGFRANPYPNWKFYLAMAYDQLGKDDRSALVGGGNNGSSPVITIWDAFLQWRLATGSEALHLTAGYFRPQLGRESITAAWASTSMEKSMSQYYQRQHLVGISNGRSVGVNLGGLLWKEGDPVGLNYNLGVFAPQAFSGVKFSPLFVGRAVLHLGDPEQTAYKIGYDVNYFNQRKGLSLALGGSWQGETDLFQAGYQASADWLFNWGPVNFDGEWSLLWREGPSDLTYRSETGYARLGYNLVVAEKYFLEPVFMWMAFRGATDAAGQADAAALKMYSGSEDTFNAGLNWYLHKKNLKLSLHYTWHAADPGAAGDGAKVNQYFSQSGMAVRRGNWVGLGVNAMF